MTLHHGFQKVAFAAALLFALGALAGNEVQVKQRAKALRDNLGDSPSAAPGPPGAPAAPAAPPPPPKLSPAQAAFGRIQTELAGIVAKGEATTEQKQRLAQAIQGAALTGGKPGETSTQTFADDLADAIAGKALSAQNCAQLAVNLNSVVNSAQTAPVQLAKTLADAQAVLRLAGVPRRDAADLGNQLKTLADEVRQAGK